MIRSSDEVKQGTVLNGHGYTEKYCRQPARKQQLSFGTPSNISFGHVKAVDAFLSPCSLIDPFHSVGVFGVPFLF
jgi:hypothetical protein